MRRLSAGLIAAALALPRPTEQCRRFRERLAPEDFALKFSCALFE